MKHPELKGQWVLLGDHVVVSLPPIEGKTNRVDLAATIIGLDVPDPMGAPGVVKVGVIFNRKPHSRDRVLFGIYLHLDQVKPVDLPWTAYVAIHQPRNGK